MEPPSGALASVLATFSMTPQIPVRSGMRTSYPVHGIRIVKVNGGDMKHTYHSIAHPLQKGLCVVLLLLLSLLIAPTLQAQVVNATLTGTVKDSSGAVIASAKVVATNTGTNLTHETVTDAQGNYRLAFAGPRPIQGSSRVARV